LHLHASSRWQLEHSAQVAMPHRVLEPDVIIDTNTNR
jgi:hypothetical protein